MNDCFTLPNSYLANNYHESGVSTNNLLSGAFNNESHLLNYDSLNHHLGSTNEIQGRMTNGFLQPQQPLPSSFFMLGASSLGHDDMLGHANINL
jgi:hypothetical protein